MATNIIKIIDSQDKVVSQTQVASGKSITVSAKEGQSYEFVSGATKRAPDEIKTTREGNNLKVEIQDGDATSTVVVEDYYTNGEGDLVGLAEDGHFYNFVPEEMGNDYMVTDLADGVSSFQALGSEGDSMSPWWLGLPLLALGAAGGGGGSGAANTLDTTAPTITTVGIETDENNDGFINAGEYKSYGIDVKIGIGEAQVGDTVTLNDGEGNPLITPIVLTATDISNGFVMVILPNLEQGEDLLIIATITDPAGNTSGLTSDTNNHDDVIFDMSDLTINGGISVKILGDANNNGLITGTECSDGKITVEVTLHNKDNLVEGDIVKLTATGEDHTREVILTQAQIDAGSVQVDFNAPEHGITFTVTAQVSDDAANASNEAEDTIEVNIEVEDITVVYNHVDFTEYVKGEWDGVDTFVLEDGNGLNLVLGGIDTDGVGGVDTGITGLFEIYDIGDNKLTINSLQDAQDAGLMSKYNNDALDDNDHALTIKGVADGEVDLELDDVAAWADTGENQVIDGVIYNVYHYSGADTSSDLWIQDGVSVI